MYAGLIRAIIVKAVWHFTFAARFYIFHADFAFAAWIFHLLHDFFNAAVGNPSWPP